MNKRLLRQRCFGSATALVAAGCLSLSARAEVFFVDAGAQGGGDGTSWAAAYTDLQDALAAAVAGDEIRVAAGVYKPVTPADSGDVSDAEREVSFELQDDVAIYGGFPPGGGDWEDRDWQLHVTVLSGDIDDNDMIDTHGIVIGADDIEGSNSFNVVTAENLGPGTLLDGFFVTAGRADGASTLTQQGGGMYLNLSDLVLNNIVFSGNYAQSWGGGVSLFNPGSRIFTHVRFQGNHSAGRCGGLRVSGGPLLLTNVAFIGNSADDWGGGACRTSTGSFTLTSVLFQGNRAGTHGGGLHNVTGTAFLNNVSFSGNDAAQSGGGLSVTNSSTAVIRNSIFWNNRANGTAGTPSASIERASGTNAFIAHSLVQNCIPGGTMLSQCGTSNGNNLTDTDPLFAGTPDPQNAPSPAGDLRLTAGSPAIDAGNDIYVDGIDLDGNDRIFGSAVDLGPYETYAELTLNTTLLDFGQVGIGQTGGPLDVVIGNTGAADLTVAALDGLAAPFSLDAGGDCGALPFTVPAGDACELTFAFNPLDPPPVAQTVTIESDNAGGDTELVLQGQGFVTDDDVFSDRFE